MKRLTKAYIWIPLLAAIAFIGGIFTSDLLNTRGGRSEGEKKLSNLLNLIGNEYVDVINTDSLIEQTLPFLLSNLDPHSVYIPAEDLQKVNEELDGSFCGVGVSFSIFNDTIYVLESVSGGPAERVGIKAGDRIIAVDGENVAGTGIANDDVFKLLRGERGSEVKLMIKRNGASAPLEYNVVRGDIPVNSIDASYLVSDDIGYIKVNKFGRTTYDEFFQSLFALRDAGAQDYIIDLRGNTGGLLETSVLMANEFLPRGFKVVETRGRRPQENSTVVSDGYGAFKDSRITVLIDEISASSSEIFAGAIQDNDRGLIIGRRSFGKGLVQHQIDLPDGSAVRLTVARYYTPSGRCIQKDYSDAKDYEYDLYNRYTSGEAFEADSIKFDDTKQFTTRSGRVVYGGGGITPDIFVPNDTVGITKYYVNVSNRGLLQNFAIDYVDNNRSRLEEAFDVNELVSMLPSDLQLVQQFARFAKTHGVDPQWSYINNSAPLIVNQLKALIARDILGLSAYYEITNELDTTVMSAIEQLREGKADFPITDSNASGAKK
ncbi:MAG: S41 family peptidase [Barnesiella sp.]|nr:S41 family peptidase [Barnesiella sp.]MBD5258883.1 S41 family peptidase [Barnesiella sp.]